MIGSATAAAEIAPPGEGECLAVLSRPDPARGRLLESLAREAGTRALLVRRSDPALSAPALSPSDLAREIAFPLRARGVPKGERARRTDEILSLAGLDAAASDAWDPDARHARMLLARAVATGRPLLVLDDLAHGLSAAARDALLRRIRLMAGARRIGIVLGTDDREAAIGVADRIAVLDRGRVVQADRPAALFERPLHAAVAVLLGDANLLNGRLERDDADDDGEGDGGGDAVRVRLPGGQAMPASLAPGTAAAAAAREDRLCSIAIRPDQVAFAAVDASEMGGDAMAATLVEHRPAGTGIRLRFRLSDGTVLRVIRPSGSVTPRQLARAAEPGGASLAWRAVHATAFPFAE